MRRINHLKGSSRTWRGGAGLAAAAVVVLATTGLAAPAQGAATMAPLREAISMAGIPTSTVADAVHDAVVDDRFWVFTHDVTLPAAGRRFDDMREGRDPSDPYEGLLG